MQSMQRMPTESLPLQIILELILSEKVVLVNMSITVKKLAEMIKKERATRLEGSFGKDKQHYYLSRIKARTKENEILWIFFGIHVSNALEIGRRMQNTKALVA